MSLADIFGGRGRIGIRGLGNLGSLFGDTEAKKKRRKIGLSYSWVMKNYKAHVAEHRIQGKKPMSFRKWYDRYIRKKEL